MSNTDESYIEPLTGQLPASSVETVKASEGSPRPYSTAPAPSVDDEKKSV